MTALYQSSLVSLPLLHRGKVRDNYALGDDRMLIVTTDRLSAFDVVLSEPIPDKGRVLNALALFWFERLSDIVPNHLTGIRPETVVAAEDIPQTSGRSMVVKRLQPILIEAVVRGYLAGSGWNDYKSTGAVCGVPLPPGLAQAARLERPIFTPAAKADLGEHDENITFDDVVERCGRDLAERIRETSLALYRRAAEYGASRGIIIADTKFEFGTDADGRLYLMDEVLTPDSSRFWPADQYRTGSSPPSFDKQFVRDYLESVEGWNKRAPAPKLPAHVINATTARYREAYEKITGRPFR
ncbi:MAG: phosphoribosylaminoimidazolesuccinocarboxamide synthase [Burkholderiaceae bacterium]